MVCFIEHSCCAARFHISVSSSYYVLVYPGGLPLSTGMFEVFPHENQMACACSETFSGGKLQDFKQRC